MSGDGWVIASYRKSWDIIIYPCHNIRKAIPTRDIVLLGVVSKFSLFVAKGFLVSPVMKISSKLWNFRFINVKTIYGRLISQHPGQTHLAARWRRDSSWKCHDIEPFPALLAVCGESTGYKWPLMGVFFHDILNKVLNKQFRWFATRWRSFDVTVMWFSIWSCFLHVYCLLYVYCPLYVYYRVPLRKFRHYVSW